MDSNRKFTTTDLLTIAIYECFGVALLTYTLVNLHVLIWPTTTQYMELMSHMFQLLPVAWVVASIIAGQVTEGHFNPAVSFAITLARGRSTASRNKWWMMFAWYWVPQFLGTIVAHYLLKMTLPDKNYGRDGALFMYQPQKDDNLYEKSYYDVTALVTEIWCAFVFCVVVLNVRARGGATGFTGSRLLSYAAEGFTLYWCILVSFRATNFSTANPAIAAGLALTTAIQSRSHLFLRYQYLNVWPFVVGPLVGAALAAWFWVGFHNASHSLVDAEMERQDLTKLSDLNFDEELDHNIPVSQVLNHQQVANV